MSPLGKLELIGQKRHHLPEDQADPEIEKKKNNYKIDVYHGYFQSNLNAHTHYVYMHYTKPHTHTHKHARTYTNQNFKLKCF